MLLPWYKLRSGADGLQFKLKFGKEWKLNQGTAKLQKYRLLYSSREILESVAKSLLRIKEHAIANVFLYLCFQLRMIYVKNIYL